MRHSLYIIIMCAALLAACSPQGHYSEFRQIDPERGWLYDDAVTFHPDSAARLRPYSVVVRHTGSYPYANIWLEVSAYGRRADTLNIPLADPYGRWYGRGLGDTYQVETPLPDLHLPADSDTVIRLRHIMRTDTLRGIHTLGLANI